MAVNQILEVNKARFVIAIEPVAFIVTECVSLPRKLRGRSVCFYKEIYCTESVYSVYKDKLQKCSLKHFE